MNSDRDLFDRFRNARSLWAVAAAVAVLGMTGCAGKPSFNILGSYFPSWLVCLAISIALTVSAHMFVTAKKLADQLWPLSIVYPALVCFLSCTLWLVFFD